MFLAAALCACGPAPAPTPEKVAKSATAPAGESRALVTRTTAPLPERYGAALPASSAELKSWQEGEPAFPPEPYVADAIAAGDAAMFERLAAAAASVPADDAAIWAEGWHDRLAYRHLRPTFCERARGVMAAEPSTLRLALAGPYAHACADAQARELVLRADTPGWAVLAWYADSREPPHGEAMPYDDRLAQVLRDALASDDRSARYGAATALARHPDSRASEALLAIHAGIADAQLADEVAESMRWSSDPRVFAIGAAACHRRTPRASDCDRRYDDGSTAGSTATAGDRADQVAIAAALNAAGFARVAAEPLVDDKYFGADDFLVRAGYAYWFDVETGTFPNEHDSLLRELAALASRALDGVVFEEIAPGLDDEEGGYLLRAYVDGERFETPAQNLGDWFDVDAVLRLLDAVVVARKAPERYVTLDSEDQTLTIVAAQPDVLRAAFAAGLITSGDTRTAEALGKGAEETVTRKLERGEIELPARQ